MKKFITYILLLFCLSVQGQSLRILDELRQEQSVIANDTDAQAFIDAVGTLTASEETIINQLVLDLKSNSLWTNAVAIYPIIGGTAAEHKWNLKDPRDLDAAFRITWGGTITHASTGAKGDGDTGFGDTHVVPGTDLSLNSTSLWFYSKTDLPDANGAVDMGINSNNSSQLILALKFDGSGGYTGLNSSESGGYTIDNAASFMGMSRTASASYGLYKNGALVHTKNDASETINNTLTIYVLAGNSFLTYSNRECAFAAIYSGLNGTESANLNTLVQTYETSLSRQN